PSLAVDTRAGALPDGPLHAPVEERVASEHGLEYLFLWGGDPPLKVTEQPLDGGLNLFSAEPERSGDVPQLGWKMIRANGDIDPDPEHRPALLRTALDEDPGDLASVHENVVRP